MVEAPMRAPLNALSLSASVLFGETPTRDIQSLRAVNCIASEPVNAATESVLIPFSHPTTGSVEATPAKFASRLVKATIDKGPPWTCFISAVTPFFCQRSNRVGRQIAENERPGPAQTPFTTGT